MKDLKEYNARIKNKEVIIVNGFLNQKEITSVKNEFISILKNSNDLSYGFGKAVRLYGISDKYPAIKSTFLSDAMLNSAKSFYGDTKFAFNTAVFLTHEFGIQGDSPNGHWHADKDHAFKFLIYLSDVGNDDGPFSYVPGSWHVGDKIRRSREGHQIRHHKKLSGMGENGVSVVGQAGTLIIFSTSVIHMGGKLNGGERMVIRGHCRP